MLSSSICMVYYVYVVCYVFHVCECDYGTPLPPHELIHNLASRHVSCLYVVAISLYLRTSLCACLLVKMARPRETIQLARARAMTTQTCIGHLHFLLRDATMDNQDEIDC